MTIVGRIDKGRGGVQRPQQAELFKHLQTLASGSHQREGDRRVFTAAQALEWAGSSGWEIINAAMHARQLPVIASMGPNSQNEEEYRFGERKRKDVSNVLLLLYASRSNLLLLLGCFLGLSLYSQLISRPLILPGKSIRVNS